MMNSNFVGCSTGKSAATLAGRGAKTDCQNLKRGMSTNYGGKNNRSYFDVPEAKMLHFNIVSRLTIRL